MYNNLPLVEFEYPDSETDYLRTRFVRVDTMNARHIKGYEFITANPSDMDEGKFKSYLLAKIVKGGVHLVEFSVV